MDGQAPVPVSPDSRATPSATGARQTDDNNTSTDHQTLRPSSLGATSKSQSIIDTFPHEVSRLVVHVQVDAEWITRKSQHLTASRQCPRDCLRNAEILEDYATRLQIHSRQIIRRALEVTNACQT